MFPRRIVSLSFALLATAALAHDADADAGADDDDEVDGGLTHVVVPPRIVTPVEAVYPVEALAQRREAHVHLELELDASGHVVNAQVIESGGEDFDDAALTAVRRYLFTPATQDGVPVRAFVNFTSSFRLPPLDADAGVPALVANSTTVLGQRPLSASSAFSVRDRDFALRPIATLQDVLRITPGLVMVQHSGGGKATQYFLRGFDADHGTDIALSVDGVPINLVSHAHGQGYADTNFIIPEAIERVELSKGPSFTNQGDFATAGAINLVSRESFEHSQVSFGFGGSPGHGMPSGRALLIANAKVDHVKASFAAELGQTNGPFLNADNFNRYKLFNRVTVELGSSATLSLVHLGYGGDWKGSGQLPARAVESGLVDRFGALDASEGGSSMRHQVALLYRLRPDEHSELKALAYVGLYRFNLFSNFTGFLVDEVNGDELEQVDRRTFFGAKLSYRVTHKLGDVRFETTLGIDARNDEVTAQLWHTVGRRRLSGERDDTLSETLAGAYLSEEVTPLSWLRLNAGLRVDGIAFSMGDRVGSAFQLSPKVNLVVSPISNDTVQWDLFANYGHGFHSNDVRATTTPLTRAIGGEVGTRAKLFGRSDVAAAGWRLDLANETVWVGDEGTTAVSDPSLRYGLELETRFEFTKWLAADLDVTFTHSELRGGGVVPLAPRQTWAGGLSARHDLGPGVLRGALRFYGVGDRPASDDGVLVAPGFTQFDLHLGYRHRWFDVAVDVENLFNGVYRAAQFATTSRLQGEPAIGAAIPAGFSCGARGRVVGSGTFQGCEEVNFTPALPFTARVTATVFLD